MTKYIYQRRGKNTMMLNKIPANTTLPAILTYLDTAAKWGARNRALFALRQQLRIKDISALQVSDVLGLNGDVRGHHIAQDGVVYLLDDYLKDELHRYLRSRFELKGNSLKPLVNTNLDVPLFPTQKRERFSNNTLAQHFCYLDKSIWQRFVIQQTTKKASISRSLITSNAHSSDGIQSN